MSANNFSGFAPLNKGLKNRLVKKYDFVFQVDERILQDYHPIFHLDSRI
ncbi:MAG: hypothetical protein ACE5EK_00705 [Nitrospinales bacterium]